VGKADLHIHTIYSYDGTATVAATLEHIVRHTDLDVVAITDHDQIDGALEAVALAPHYGIDVIPGSEVSTAQGHLLALFVDHLIPPGLSLVETLHAIAEQGGLAIAAHPGGWWPWCLKEEALRMVFADPVAASTMVGLESFNASLPNLGANRAASLMAQRLPALAQVGCSDAHMLWMIGMAATQFAGRGSADLKRALLQGATAPVVARRPAYYYLSHIKRQLLRQCGLADWSPRTPGGPIALRRLTAISS
jgi:predicted metal-dependent phosphoesterase TrpH